jgi:hypothetical protein
MSVERELIDKLIQDPSEHLKIIDMHVASYNLPGKLRRLELKL